MPHHLPQLQVHAQRHSRTLALQPGDELLKLTQLLAREGFPLNNRCAGQGLCDGCLIELRSGQLQHIASGKIVQATEHPIKLRACEHRLPDESFAVGGLRLAVQSDAASTANRKPQTANPVIHLPARSLLAHSPQVVSNFKIRIPWGHQPLGHSHKDIAQPLGCAVDIGTTTVALLLVDLTNDRVLAKFSMFNQQTRFGDDVLTRITLCGSDPDMLATLQRAITHHTLRPLVEQALAKAQADASQLVCYTVAGNTTMLHLFAGVDPTPMGVVPFTPAFLDHRVLHAADLDLPGHPEAQVHLLPGASAYVGADLVAGCLATGQAYQPGPILLVDVGTNGEIILKHGDKLTGCATAAGPAFEGAKLSSGMRAADGAIEHIRFADSSVQCDVIAGGEPTGVCGSAYVDMLANGRAAGLLNEAGRFNGSLPHLPRDTQHGKALMLHEPDKTSGGGGDTSGGDTFGGQTVTISESDIASLLQAKAAIAAGMLTLTERMGLAPSDIQKLYLAGGFGLHIDIASAIRCGLLPGFTVDQVEAVGNTSLAGAFVALLDKGILDEMKHIAKRIEIIELNHDPEFEMRYIDQLSLV
ncbi:MAG: ASKHA domain-containing protein [Phycisphaeraceae bacterium]